MAQYLLSVQNVEGEVSDPMTDEEMQQFMRRVHALEEEMRSTGTYVFGGALTPQHRHRRARIRR
jgi:hypothetical protein